MSKSASTAPRHFIHNGSVRPTSELSNSLTSGEKVIYEVIRVSRSAPIFLNEHLARMEQSVALSQLKSINMGTIRNSVKELLRVNPVEQQNIKLVASYGAGNAEPSITAFFIASKYPDEHDRLNGVCVKTIPATRSNPEVKAENRALRSHADQVIASSQCYEVLMVNRAGQLTEGSRSNMFFAIGNRLHTAPLSAVLGGITRQKVIEICQKRGIEVVHECLDKAHLTQLGGAFLTGTSPGVLAISRIDTVELSVNFGPTKLIGTEYDALVQHEIERWRAEHPL